MTSQDKLLIKGKLNRAVQKLLEVRALLPMDLFRPTEGGNYRVLWFINRQKPSIEACYDFDEERFGITIDGNIIWGFDSGCS